MIRNTLFNSGKFLQLTQLLTDLSLLRQQSHKLQNIWQLSNPKILLNHGLVKLNKNCLKTYLGSFHDDHSVI